MTETATTSVTPPCVAIVVLNWNGWNDTIECLEALQQLDYSDFQIIVVDNSSSDTSVVRISQWARGELPVASALVPYDAASKPVHYVECTRVVAEGSGIGERDDELRSGLAGRRLVLIGTGANLGFSAGNNVGLRYALVRGFKHVLLLNNDVVVQRDTLNALVSSLEEHPEWAGVAPKVVQRDDPERILYAGGAIRLWQARAVHVGRSATDGPRWTGSRITNHVSACCALYRAEFLRAAGLLDEDFFFGQEDVALSCLAQRLGWRLGVQLDARVVHNEGHSLEDQPATSVYYYAKYRVLLLTKYGAWWQIITGTVFLIATRLPKFAWLMLRGRARLVRAELRGYRDALAGRFGDYDRAVARASG